MGTPPTPCLPACLPARLPAAPEVCAGESYRGRQADMWALGVSLFIFIFGELPFKVGWPTELPPYSSLEGRLFALTPLRFAGLAAGAFVPPAALPPGCAPLPGFESSPQFPYPLHYLH